MNIMKTLNSISLLLAIGLIAGCSSDLSLTDKELKNKDSEAGSDSAATNDVSDDETIYGKPDDRTGSEGQVEILFGTHIGNPSMNLLESQPQVFEIEVSDKLTIETAVMNVEKIQMVPASSAMAKWAGPYRYDLLNGTSSPPIEAITISDGTYKKIDFKVRPYDAKGDDEDRLGGLSMFIAGTVMVADLETNFEVRFANNEKFSVESLDGANIQANETNYINIKFDISTWFENIDFEQATVSDDDVLVLSNKENKKLYQTLRKSIKDSVRFPGSTQP